jgi:N-acetylmuramoyl-L-alanine amidase
VKSFTLGPEGGHGHRLVIDLIPKTGGGAPAAGPAAAPAAGGAHLSVRSRSAAARPVVVAIDAGHGGKDPGAIGAHGTREKDITLAIARRLSSLVAKEAGMRPVMIRDGDVFVPLRQRILTARKHKADIFISIHADAFTDPGVRGSSVFTLSERGATSEAAKWLADRENSADLIGGVDLKTSDDVLANVLLNMSQNATLEHSGEAAAAVLQNLSRLGDTHKAQVQKAGFVVLKSPDIPSLLVETAFISNPKEEARLKTAAYQQRLAEAILGGVKAYFQKFPPRGMRLEDVASVGGGRTHTIVGGDTLAEIAQRYQVSLSSLRSVNQLQGDDIRVGQVLTIPEGG